MDTIRQDGGSSQKIEDETENQGRRGNPHRAADITTKRVCRGFAPPGTPADEPWAEWSSTSGAPHSQEIICSNEKSMQHTVRQVIGRSDVHVWRTHREPPRETASTSSKSGRQWTAGARKTTTCNAPYRPVWAAYTLSRAWLGSALKMRRMWQGRRQQIAKGPKNSTKRLSIRQGLTVKYLAVDDPAKAQRILGAFKPSASRYPPMAPKNMAPKTAPRKRLEATSTCETRAPKCRSAKRKTTTTTICHADGGDRNYLALAPAVFASLNSMRSWGPKAKPPALPPLPSDRSGQYPPPSTASLPALMRPGDAVHSQGL